MAYRYSFRFVGATDQHSCSTMFGLFDFGITHKMKEEDMALTIHRQRWISSCARVFSGVLGCGLLGLLLTASLSWAQLPPTPTPPPTGIIIFQVTIIAPESGQAAGSDCFRLDPTTGAFTSDFFSAQGLPSGFWYAFSLEQGQPSLFTAHVTALATSSDGQPLPFAVSYGGILDLQGPNGGVGSIVYSDGTPYAYQAQINPSCALPPPSPAAQGKAPSSSSRPLETLLGYGN
jgi:hypothetical protein